LNLRNSAILKNTHQEFRLLGGQSFYFEDGSVFPVSEGAEGAAGFSSGAVSEGFLSHFCSVLIPEISVRLTCTSSKTTFLPSISDSLQVGGLPASVAGTSLRHLPK
jgi:hypothetical protein